MTGLAASYSLKSGRFEKWEPGMQGLLGQSPSSGSQSTRASMPEVLPSCEHIIVSSYLVGVVRSEEWQDRLTKAYMYIPLCLCRVSGRLTHGLYLPTTLPFPICDPAKRTWPDALTSHPHIGRNLRFSETFCSPQLI